MHKTTGQSIIDSNGSLNSDFKKKQITNRNLIESAKVIEVSIHTCKSGGKKSSSWPNTIISKNIKVSGPYPTPFSFLLPIFFRQKFREHFIDLKQANHIPESLIK